MNARLRSSSRATVFAWVALWSAVSFGAAAAGDTPAESRPVVQSPHGAFQEDCAMCHKPDAWTPAKISSRFDHSKYGFPLEGSHKNAPCLQCHLTLEFTTARGSKCMDCHQDVHLGEMGPDCARCHSTRDFIDRSEAMRTHRSTTFPLTGAHLTVDCASCHRPTGASAMQFVNTGTACDGCHMAQYRATTSPNHQTAGFPTTCNNCHSTTMWSSGGFDHASTGFPLTGAHRTAECAACHAGNKFTPISPECVSCHRSSYDATTSPPHTAVGFPVQCASCHNTTSWSGAAFDHATTGFALTGAHTTVACQMCHVPSAPPPQAACVSCHRAQYDATTDPAHAGAGFPTDCASCHNTTSWAGATFNHDGPYFPIYSGTHAGRWSACIDCHTTQTNYVAFECILCHAHSNRSQVDSHHTGISGYSYDSAACYRCHPRGRAG